MIENRLAIMGQAIIVSRTYRDQKNAMRIHSLRMATAAVGIQNRRAIIVVATTGHPIAFRRRRRAITGSVPLPIRVVRTFHRRLPDRKSCLAASIKTATACSAKMSLSQDSGSFHLLHHRTILMGVIQGRTIAETKGGTNRRVTPVRALLMRTTTIDDGTMNDRTIDDVTMTGGQVTLTAPRGVTTGQVRYTMAALDTVMAARHAMAVHRALTLRRARVVRHATNRFTITLKAPCRSVPTIADRSSRLLEKPGFSQEQGRQSNYAGGLVKERRGQLVGD
jgi:hypothetical protein